MQIPLLGGVPAIHGVYPDRLFSLPLEEGGIHRLLRATAEKWGIYICVQVGSLNQLRLLTAYGYPQDQTISQPNRVSCASSRLALLLSDSRCTFLFRGFAQDCPRLRGSLEFTRFSNVGFPTMPLN